VTCQCPSHIKHQSSFFRTPIWNTISLLWWHNCLQGTSRVVKLQYQGQVAGHWKCTFSSYLLQWACNTSEISNLQFHGCQDNKWESWTKDNPWPSRLAQCWCASCEFRMYLVQVYVNVILTAVSYYFLHSFQEKATRLQNRPWLLLPIVFCSLHIIILPFLTTLNNLCKWLLHQLPWILQVTDG